MRTLRLVLVYALLGASARSSAASPAAPKTFSTPRQAAEELVAAAGAQDVPALLAIFGTDGSALVVSGDDVADKNDRAKFADLAREKLDVVIGPKDPHTATIVVGNEAWPFPVPLVDKKGQWRFNTQAGLREVLDRRVGANELDAIQVCRGYVEAQREYAQGDWDGDGVRQYAQKVISTAGKRDGLVWRNADGTLDGPVSEGIANAIAEGYSDKSQPYHGYHFRILKKQGPSARLGAMDYVIGGKMIGGFALVAWPAAYAVSGVKTFVVNHDGIVYEKDLGKNTAKVVAGMDSYDPNKSWSIVPQ